jgi:large subunit ribosomal protein L10
MPKTEKVQKVAELTERIRGSEALFITDYRGLTVADVTELRRSLRDSGTRLTVAKNTLLRRAAGEAGIDGLDALLEGPTAVAFVDGDPINAAKGLVDAIKRFRTLEIRGGYMEGKVLSSAEAESLATIEPREVLLAKMAGVLKAEMSRAAYMFQSLQSKFLSVLEAYKEKVPGEAEPEAAASEPEAAPEAAASEPEAAAADEPSEAAEEAAPESPSDEAPAEAEAAEPAAQATTEAEAEAESSDEAEAGTEAEASTDAEAGTEAEADETSESEETSETDEAPGESDEAAGAEGKE